jgi:DNA polymerase-1
MPAISLGKKRQGGGAVLFDPGLAPDQIKAIDALSVLRPLLESTGILKIGFNIKFSAVLLAQHGATLRNHDDAQLMSYALDAGRNAHGLEALAERWLGHAVINYGGLTGSGKKKLFFDQVAIGKATEYSAESADVILRLWHVLKPRLVAERMTSVYEMLERPLVSVLARMERRGISIDRRVLSRLSGEFARPPLGSKPSFRRSRASRSMSAAPSRSATSSSAGWRITGGTKTKTGAWSTSAQVLDELAEQGHEFRRDLEWRQVSKLKSTYTDALPEYVHPQTHRVHTTYALAATTTGRLSSNERTCRTFRCAPRTARKIRRAFIATPRPQAGVGGLLTNRVAAIGRDRRHSGAGNRPSATGLDIHAMTASEMFGVPIKDMPSEVRRRARGNQFRHLYGISAFGLANQLGIAREEASAYIKKYFERFPGIRAYMDETRDFCRANGYVETLFAANATYPDIKASNASIRSFNERCDQRATAGLRCRHHPPRHDPDGRCAGREKLSAQMLLQVHDERSSRYR